MIKISADHDIPQLNKLIRTSIDTNNIEINYFNHSDINNKNISESEILLVRSTTKVNKSLLENTKIKFVASATSGINHLDIDYLESQKIKWGYAAGCNSSSVTHYVLAVIAELIEEKKINYDSKIGIIGYGNIGKKLSKYLEELNFDIFIYDPYINNNKLVDFNTILKCDLVSIHVPFTKGGLYPTHKLIESYELEQLSNKVLINSSRGGIVNEKAILKNNITYIADVWENEPMPNNELVTRSYIATPHIAGYSKQGKLNGSVQVVRLVSNYLENKKDTSPFNFQDVSKIDQEDIIDKSALGEILPLDIFNKTFDVKSISDEMKDFFKKNLSNNEIATSFNQMRRNHPDRNDFDSKDFLSKNF